MARKHKHIFISTGEVSGDWHGADLIKALLAEAPARGIDLEITALGGDRMAATPAKLLGNTAGIGSVGALEAVRFVLPTLWLQQKVKRCLQQHPPDLVVLIDYMLPNIMIGNFAKRVLGVPVVYYIAPQEWVWSINDRNTRQIAGFTDRLFAIFPEEANYYRRQHIPVEWVGHPCLASLATVPDRAVVRAQLGMAEDVPLIALLPASRIQEIEAILPIIVQAGKLIATKLPTAQFWLPLSRSVYRDRIARILAKWQLPATITEMPSQWIIRAADLVLAKSGTVNLETAILDVPQVVCYRVHPITAWLARHITKVKFAFACPANLVLMRAVVPELLQENATPAQIAELGLQLLTDPLRRQAMLDGYREIRSRLGQGNAVVRVAQGILDMLL
ncbi:MAG: lipid-A-disaccharide synthase [Pseudanabaenaceae cyanobacterium]